MKKIFYFAVVAMFAVTMVACGGNAEKKAEKSETPAEKVIKMQAELEAALENGDDEKAFSIAEQMDELLQDPEVFEAYEKEMMKAADEFEKAVAGVDDELEDAWDEALEETSAAYKKALKESSKAYESAMDEYEAAMEDAVDAYEDALSGLDW